MAPNTKSSSRFRMKKLSKQTLQSILREDQIDSSEYDANPQNEKLESGVEKAEEKEYHLQAAVAANAAGAAAEEIPAPPAEECTTIDYDKLYPLVFKKPASYIRFSQTVEECTSCQYDMTSEDDVYLKSLNQQKKSGPKCSENDFEKIMEAFENTASEHTPWASVDNTLIPFETMQTALKQAQFAPKILAFAKDIYEHWKARRQESGNTPLQPSLKFEKDPERDDGDPYVCFRRRDARQTRKTRNRDVQSTDKLRRLRKELEDGRDLVRLALVRETTKRDLLKIEKEIFESRIRIKDTKVKLGIKTDDDDLINQRPQKRKHSDFAQRPSGPQMRLPGRSDGRALDADLIQLSDLIAQKENLLQAEIEEQAEKHRKWNLNHVDLTRGPLSPVNGQETSFRPAKAKTSYLMTPPSSVTSESFDQASPILDKPEPFGFQYRSSSPPEEESRGQPAYRRRIGRGGRLWIDRKGMSGIVKGADNGTSDRWQYDQDDDDEQPSYECDPYDTKALKFRATIPFPSHLQQQRPVGARPNGNSPNNTRAIAAPQPPPPPAVAN